MSTPGRSGNGEAMKSRSVRRRGRSTRVNHSTPRHPRSRAPAMAAWVALVRAPNAGQDRFMWMNSLKLKMPTQSEALAGRAERMAVPSKHFVLGTPLEPPFPSGMELALFGMGCFWGAEKMFWKLEGVYSTSVGYAGGFTP